MNKTEILSKKLIDKRGKKFGSVTVTGLEGKYGRNYKWFWECDCGNTGSSFGGSFKNMKGCRKCSSITHNQSKTNEYKIWANILQRCYNKNNPAYKWYGQRGIITSEEWKTFENFIKDMGDRPSKKHSVERVDVNDNYKKENCIWIESDRQNQNKRNNVIILSGDLVFKSTNECSEYFKYSPQYINDMLKGRRKNKFNLIYG